MKTLRKVACAAVLAGALFSGSASAEVPSGDDELARIGAAMEEAFAAEPLSAEAEERLPSAAIVAGKIMPDGTYARMMEDTLQRVLQPMTAIMPKVMPTAELATALGVNIGWLDQLSENGAAEISTMLDPHYRERSEAMMNGMMKRMGQIMAEMEPDIRDGLARAYASRFSQQELDDIAAFFATPSGERYATESMLIFTDPQTMSAAMKGMPKMLSAMPELLTEAGESASHLPPAREVESLTAAERTRIADLLGIPAAELGADRNESVEVEGSDEQSDDSAPSDAER